jgi:hypothetical protein
MWWHCVKLLNFEGYWRASRVYSATKVAQVKSLGRVLFGRINRIFIERNLISKTETPES